MLLLPSHNQIFQASIYRRYSSYTLVLASRLSTLKVCLRIKGIVFKTLYWPNHRAIYLYCPVVPVDLRCQSGMLVVVEEAIYQAENLKQKI